MDTKNRKSVTVDDGNLAQAHQKYLLLKQVVEDWRKERGTYWLDKLGLAEEPPYLPALNLPSEAIIELWQRLNVAAKAEIPKSDLRALWDQFRGGQGIADAELLTRLQLAFSGVAKLASQMAYEKIGTESVDFSTSVLCPVCGERAALACITPPDGQRIMFCHTCSYEWAVRRTGCLFCGSTDLKQQIYLQNEEFPGVEMVVCQECGEYFKELDVRQLIADDYVWEDLRTLALNFAAEQWLAEKAKQENKVH